MHLLEHLHRNVKTVAMPTAMVVGALLCRPISALEELSGQMITPTLIFLMLFVTFCRVKPSQMKPSMLHVWLLLVQTVACIGVFLLLRPLDLILAQGAMVCVLAPVAMAAVVIGGMLGANVATMATYSLLCNMAVALLAPVILTFTGTGACTFAQILARIAPLLVMPFAAAQFCRLVIPKAAKWVGDHSQISFYMWLASLLVIIGRTTVTLLSGNECMVLSSEKSIISSSGTNIKQEAEKDYDVAAKNGTVNGVNLMIEGKGNVTVSGGIVKFNS